MKTGKKIINLSIALTFDEYCELRDWLDNSDMPGYISKFGSMEEYILLPSIQRKLRNEKKEQNNLTTLLKRIVNETKIPEK